MAAAGSGVIEIARLGSSSVVSRARAQSPLSFVTPRNAGRAVWVYVANFGGGLVNGDRLVLDVTVASDAAAVFLTQGSTKIYRSPAGTQHDLRAVVAGGGTLILMPERVTCFAGARYAQRQRIDLDPESSVVVVDCLTAGRIAMGERWAFDSYAASISIFRSGRPVLLDRLCLSQADGPIADRMRRFDACASVVLTGPAAREAAALAERRVAARRLERRMDLVAMAAPLCDGGTLLRLAARSVATLVDELAAIVRPAVAPLGDDPALYRW